MVVNFNIVCCVLLYFLNKIIFFCYILFRELNLYQLELKVQTKLMLKVNMLNIGKNVARRLWSVGAIDLERKNY